MKIWFTADSHFGHANCIKYTRRPYKDVDDMREQIIEKWNSRVDVGDVVYHLGDMSLNKNRAFEVIPRLNGTIILVCGNHDECFPLTKEKHLNAKAKYIEAGIYYITMGQSLIIGMNNDPIKTTEVYLTHLPPMTPEQAIFDNRYEHHRIEYNPNMWYLHGHLHGHSYMKYKNFVDVGWDCKLDLFSEDEVIDLIYDERTFIPSRISPLELKLDGRPMAEGV